MSSPGTTPDTRVRWGILSTGWIAERFVADLRLLPDAEVVAVGSRTAEAARAFAGRHAIPRAYGSWQELAADPDLDVIYVATPHSAHLEAALVCVAAGRAVLVEKPLTLDLATSRQLADAARDAGVFLMEAMWTRCFPAIHRVAGLVADGAIGRVTAVHADFGLRPSAAGPRHLDPRLGGGALLDLGVYPITIAHLVLGPPDGITARARLTAQGIDENTAVVASYDSGAVALLSCSLVGDSPRRATITGTEGRIELPRDFFRPSSFTVYREAAQGAQEELTVHTPFDGWGYHFEAAEVHRCLRAGRTESGVVPVSETLAVMATLDTVRSKIGVSYD